ncbi:MAG: 2-amino-4-hydroxy-6-hydroxymethyldihydropteridine diphosphokinase [Flavipsychrobacter sp.]
MLQQNKGQLNTKNTAYLLLGSNEGDREQWISTAIKYIEKEVGHVTRQSAFYQTAAWGIEEQPDFLNMAIAIETELTPIELLDNILAIEQQLGRERTLKWGQRTIDIDILFYNDIILETERLTVPHPYIHKRNFALVPLEEIAPNLLHPILNKDITQLLDNCTDKLQVTKLK